MSTAPVRSPLTRARATPPPAARGLYLDGDDDSVALPASFTAGGDMTVAAWVKVLAPTQPASGRFVDFRDSSNLHAISLGLRGTDGFLYSALHTTDSNSPALELAVRWRKRARPRRRSAAVALPSGNPARKRTRSASSAARARALF